MKNIALLSSAICLSLSISTFAGDAAGKSKDAQTMKVNMYKVTSEGLGETIGQIHIKDENGGLVFKPKLSGLTSGLHGFHVHENSSCMPSKKDGKTTPAGAAGSHLNLLKAEHHNAPWSDGHTGDLPALFVDSDGKASHPVFAPKLHKGQIDGKAIIIHAGGDNYSDDPKPLGGGGDRVACGIIGK